MIHVYPNVRTPTLDLPSLIAFAREINKDSDVVSVKMAGRLKPLGNCYWNVANVVEESGGCIEFGWVFFYWPNLYLEAMHHAVWRHPDGRLIDVTEKYPTDPVKSSSTFLPDTRTKFDLRTTPMIPSKFLPLTDRKEVLRYFDLYMARNELEVRYAKTLWNLGYRCESQFATAAGVKLPIANIDQADTINIELLNSLKPLIEAANRSLTPAILAMRGLGTE